MSAYLALFCDHCDRVIVRFYKQDKGIKQDVHSLRLRAQMSTPVLVGPSGDMCEFCLRESQS